MRKAKIGDVIVVKEELTYVGNRIKVGDKFTIKEIANDIIFIQNSYCAGSINQEEFKKYFKYHNEEYNKCEDCDCKKIVNLIKKMFK